MTRFPFSPLDPRVHLLMSWPNDAYAPAAAPFAPQWVDITYEVDTDHGDIVIRRGRRDWASRVDVTSCTVPLMNRTGQFSPRNPLGGYRGLFGRNSALRVGVGEPPIGQASVFAAPGTSHDAPAVALAAGGKQFCAWMASSVGNYTVPGGMTADTEMDGSLSTLRTATIDVSLPAATGKTATFSTSPSYIATMSVVVPGTVTYAASSATATAGADATVTTGSVTEGDWLLAIQGWSSDSAGEMTAIPRDVGVHTCGWMMVMDSGPSAGPRLKCWMRRVTATGAQSVVFTGKGDSTADHFARIFACGGVTPFYARAVVEVPSWPSRWDQSNKDVWVPIQGAGVMRRLGGKGASTLRSPLHRHMVKAPSILGYWPMEDESNSTSFASALGGFPMRFLGGKADLASDSDFACSDSIPQFTSTGAEAQVTGHTSGEFFAGALVRLPAAGTTDEATILQVSCAGGTVARWLLRYDTPNRVRLLALSASGSTLLDRQMYGQLDGNGFYVWVQAKPSGSDIAVELWTALVFPDDEQVYRAFAFDTITAQTIGRITSVAVGSDLNLTDGVSVGHVAVASDSDGVFSAPTTSTSTVPDRSSTRALVAWQNEDAHSRILRLCREERVPCHVANGAVSEGMGAQQPGKLLDLLQQCADTDGGFLYEPMGLIGLGYRTRESVQNQGGV